MSEEIRANVEKAKMLGHKKVAGEHSLTVGEIVFTVLGILIIVYGTRANIPAKYKLGLGLAVVFMGEWLF